MSLNYAAQFKPNENKGVLGLPECVDSSDRIIELVNQLSQLIRQAGHVVIHTGLLSHSLSLALIFSHFLTRNLHNPRRTQWAKGLTPPWRVRKSQTPQLWPKNSNRKNAHLPVDLYGRLDNTTLWIQPSLYKLIDTLSIHVFQPYLKSRCRHQYICRGARFSRSLWHLDAGVSWCSKANKREECAFECEIEWTPFEM